MARPIRKNADYFTHFANFRNDRRVKAIRTQFGVCGYGLTLMLIEVLTDSDGFELDTNDVELDLLSGDLGVPVTEIDALIQFAIRVQLFSKNEAGKLICPILNDWLQPVLEKRAKSRNGGNNRVSATETTDTDADTQQNVPSGSNLSQDAAESTQSRVEKSRGEESRGEKRDTSVSPVGGASAAPVSFKVELDGAGRMKRPTQEQVIGFVLTLPGGTREIGEDMYDYCKSKGWKVGKEPMKDWIHAARRWVRKNRAGGEYAPADAESNAPQSKSSFV